MTKTVLCYGDSNTFGAATVDRPDGRYGPDERWPGVVAAQLGGGWRVIEEGLNGRTTVRDDPIEGAFRNGKSYLLPCLLTHMPLDAVVIMLGTNDLKARFNIPTSEIAAGVGVLAGIVQQAEVGPGGSVPEILVVAPPPVLAEIPFHGEMFAGAYDKALQFADKYAAMAKEAGIHFLDAGSVVTSSRYDGFHLDPEAHRALGEAVAGKLQAVAG